MSTTVRLGVLGGAFTALVLAGLLASGDGLLTLASPGGLQNPGFEDGLDPWVIQSAPDVVSVVDQEGPADFQMYADRRITVEPYRGRLMLRLGSPKRLAESQKVGANTVRQTFVSDRSSLEFAFRLFSWEHRGSDVFAFDLRDQSGKVPPNLVVSDMDTGGPLVVTM